MPKRATYPKPSKRYAGGAWVILWRFSPAPGEYRQYTVSTGLTRKKEDELAADIIQRRFAAALAQDRPKFPAEYAATAGVRRYMADRLGLKTSGGWLADYEPVINQEVVASWARPSLSMLRRLDEFTEGRIEHTTPDQASGFLVNLLADGLSPARRNRALIMCNRFFKWAVRTCRAQDNPFAGIKLLREAKRGEIAYCTKEERDAIIQLARESGEPDWLAVPVAFYAGMRRGELYRMRWEDVVFRRRFIAVEITKTERPRKVPLNSTLEQILMSVPANRRHGFVAVVPDGTTSRVDRANSLLRVIRRMARDGEYAIPDERIGWNAWRHTFASLLVQSGVTLDKISSWMGNTPEVCRRHYAQFVPRDGKDDDIERL